jgi:hypothetical protein
LEACGAARLLGFEIREEALGGLRGGFAADAREVQGLRFDLGGEGLDFAGEAGVERGEFCCCCRSLDCVVENKSHGSRLMEGMIGDFPLTFTFLDFGQFRIEFLRVHAVDGQAIFGGGKRLPDVLSTPNRY